MRRKLRAMGLRSPCRTSFPAPLLPALVLGFGLGCFSDPGGADEGDEGDETEACAGVIDECGVCGGPGGPCTGCTVAGSSNYDPMAELNDGTCSCTPAGGSIADQSQLESNLGGGGMDVWQSFTPGVAGGLASLTIETGSPLDPEPATVTLEILEGEGLGGTTLTSFEAVFQPGLASLQTFELAEPVPLAVGERYTFRIVVPEQTSGYLSYQDGDPYPEGTSSIDGDRDLTFRTEMVTCAPE
ncbi:hypothetical protein PPSIR1_00580 [Plesiocystis pacifica SIR-1]|uniref:Lipoprotein n=2 Tax=Plesiocystis pacifica TaxID=191768 RepID=A6G7H4_9BACT|nr:hypothetical protein PPSIR1_00580 [Plesiocystis pacifica SIR-1]